LIDTGTFDFDLPTPEANMQAGGCGPREWHFDKTDLFMDHLQLRLVAAGLPDNLQSAADKAVFARSSVLLRQRIMKQPPLSSGSASQFGFPSFHASVLLPPRLHSNHALTKLKTVVARTNIFPKPWPTVVKSCTHQRIEALACAKYGWQMFTG
jgi:hypothetical protein